MRIYCIGNEAVNDDHAPILLFSDLKKQFPAVTLSIIDPAENFIPEPLSILIDTVDGIDDVRTYTDIDVFLTTKSVTVHDYDLGFHLQLLKKMHKLPTILIIGVPRRVPVAKIRIQVIEKITQYLREMKTSA